MTEPDASPALDGRGLFWMWFAANAVFTNVLVGAQLALLGLDGWQAVGSIAVGTTIFAVVGLAAVPGIDTGRETMELSRRVFGRANAVIAGLSTVSIIGWQAIYGMIATGAVRNLVDGSGVPVPVVDALGILLVVGVPALFAAASLAAVGTVQRWCGLLLIVMTVGVCVVLLHGSSTAASIPTTGGGGLAPTVTATLLVAAVPLSWVNYASDYAVGGHPLTRHSATVSTWAGGQVPTAVLAVTGYVLATRLGRGDLLDAASRRLDGGPWSAYLVLVVLGCASNNVLNARSGALAVADLLGGRRRIGVVVSVGAAALLAIIGLRASALESGLVALLSVGATVLAPWVAVFLAHYLGAAPIAGPRRAVLAYGGGLAAGVLTASNQVWESPVAAALGLGDVSAVVGAGTSLALCVAVGRSGGQG